MDATKCPVCGKSINLTFTDTEIAQGGRNAVCPRCQKVLWISNDGKIKSLPLVGDEDFSRQHQDGEY